MSNTLITLSDNKIGIDNNADNRADYYQASVLSATDYYAFGMSMKERTWQSESYRYGFNGKENDTDWDVQDYGFRIYKPELGKFLSVDPIAREYPFYSPYHFAGNRPIGAIDLDGLEPWDIQEDLGGVVERTGYGTPREEGGRFLGCALTYNVKLPNETQIEIFRFFMVGGSDNSKYNCMGYVFSKGEYWINEGGNELISSIIGHNNPNTLHQSSVIREKRIPKSRGNQFRGIRKGDVVTFFGGAEYKDNQISHVAIYNGAGTYTTKNGAAPLNDKATLDDMIESYPDTKQIGYFRPPSLKSNIIWRTFKKIVEKLFDLIKIGDPRGPGGDSNPNPDNPRGERGGDDAQQPGEGGGSSPSPTPSPSSKKKKN